MQKRRLQCSHSTSYIQKEKSNTHKGSFLPLEEKLGKEETPIHKKTFIKVPPFMIRSTLLLILQVIKKKTNMDNIYQKSL